MRKLFIVIIFLSLPLLGLSQQLPVLDSGIGHPRILLLEGEEQEIKATVERDEYWGKLHQAILDESEAIISLEVLERKQIGRRLLSVSREALRRIFYLSYAYRMTGEEKYAQRAEKEMLTISGFSDWNPTHFLDVAEMTMAMAIGYDWLEGELNETSKEKISNAIIGLGIEPSFDNRYNGFLRATHNWNQVCNAGMAFGALAVYEKSPELAQKTLERAIETIKLPMEDYKPDGAYPEGYSYWDYGTTFNVLFLDAIEKVYQTDFGLTQTQGFLETAGFYKNMTGVTDLPYNWGDAGSGPGSLTPAMFWFAQKKNSSSLLWVERKQFQDGDLARFTRNRILPAAMIWGRGLSLEEVETPSRKVWIGQGPMPVAMMRTSWTDPLGIYLGFKAGSPSVNHGHMDIGAFLMESDGVRWAMDFGMQNYESLESKGIQLFGRTQDAQRWTVFRLNNFVHNTLTVDEELQRVDGYGKIDKFSDNEAFSFAVSDVSSAYSGQLERFARGAGIVDQAFVVVRDEVKNDNKPSTVRWVMLTPADVDIQKDEVVLQKDGQRLHLRVQGLENVNWKTWTTQPDTDYDAPNPGTIRLGFEYEIQAGEELDYQVLLIPAKNLGKEKQMSEKKLADW